MTVSLVTPAPSSARRPHTSSTASPNARTTRFIARHTNEVLSKKCLPTFSLSAHTPRWKWVQRHMAAHKRAKGKCLLPVRMPHAWACIHRYEGSWQDDGDPYWGGLQMDRGFMETYAPQWLLAKGFANHWTPNQQMWVAERAYFSGRGFWPWPNTARFCGLL